MSARYSLRRKSAMNENNNSEKSNLSTITSGNPNEKSVRFLDNSTHDTSTTDPDNNV